MAGDQDSIGIGAWIIMTSQDFSVITDDLNFCPGFFLQIFRQLFSRSFLPLIGLLIPHYDIDQKFREFWAFAVIGIAGQPIHNNYNKCDWQYDQAYGQNPLLFSGHVVYLLREENIAMI